MSLVHYVYLYLLTVPVFFAIDMLWLGYLSRGLYQTQLAHLLGPIQWGPAIIFYLLYIVGILIFAVVPALHAESLRHAVLYGALFGFFAYATYDLTNLATLRDWPILITVVDMIWGAVLTSSVATASYLIGRALFF
jgi:uncharacterized membrane protein